MNESCDLKVPVRAIVSGAKEVGKSAFMAQLCDTNINENLEYERRIFDPKLGAELLVQFSDRVEELSKAMVVFIVVDLMQAESFEYAKNVAFPEAIKRMNSEGFIYLIGNKVDQEAKREIKNEEIAQFASDKCIAYTEVCSLSHKRKGIDVVQRMFKFRLTNLYKANKAAFHNEPKQIIEEARVIADESTHKPIRSEKNSSPEIPMSAEIVEEESKEEESLPPELPPREMEESLGFESLPFSDITNHSNNRNRDMPRPVEETHFKKSSTGKVLSEIVSTYNENQEGINYTFSNDIQPTHFIASPKHENKLKLENINTGKELVLLVNYQ